MKLSLYLVSAKVPKVQAVQYLVGTVLSMFTNNLLGEEIQVENRSSCAHSDGKCHESTVTHNQTEPRVTSKTQAYLQLLPKVFFNP